jgi:hypothetical protein
MSFNFEGKIVAWKKIKLSILGNIRRKSMRLHIERLAEYFLMF